MSIRIAPAVMAVSLLFAAAHAAPADARRTVTLDRAAQVGDTVVPAGTYRLELPAGLSKARFEQGTRTVAEVDCKVGLAEVVYPGTAVHYRTEGSGPDTLVKIVFSSSNLAVEFPGGAAEASDAPVAGNAGRR